MLDIIMMGCSILLLMLYSFVCISAIRIIIYSVLENYKVSHEEHRG
jgi:hypothetical protein